MGKGKPTITIVCPVYEGERLIRLFDASLRMQKGVELCEVKYVLTKSKDRSKEILGEICNDKTVARGAGRPWCEIAKFEEIEPKDFSHSLTREKAAMNAKGEVVVFLTQDVEIRDADFLLKLVAPIAREEAIATYARQRAKHNNIEKYTREYNYPEQSRLVSADDIDELGLKTFFFSDAAGAVSAEAFRKLNGYDGKKLPISEDMYLAHKIIMDGGKIRYTAEAEVFHSHEFSFKQLYGRYKETGKFFKQNPEIAKHSQLAAGGGMAKYILSSAVKERNWVALGNFVPNMAVRFVGMRRGER